MKLIKSCLYCKNEFEVFPSKFERSKYCSKECYDIDIKTRDKTIYFYICDDCKEVVPTVESSLRIKNTPYCRKCYGRINAPIGYNFWRGKQHTKESIIKMSKPRKKKWKNGPHDIETKKKISRTLQEKWKNPEFRKQMEKSLGMFIDRIKSEGKCEYDYPPEFNKYLRLLIRERDKFICQECGYTEEQLGYNLSVHHIDYDKRNFNFKNLISLCKPCHAQTNFNRDDWKKYYMEKLNGY